MDKDQELAKPAPSASTAHETLAPHELKNRTEMVQAYTLAVRVNNPTVWAEMMRRYPSLIDAYEYRRKILEQQTNEPADQRISIMVLDQCIIKKIADGELADLSQAKTEPELNVGH